MDEFDTELTVDDLNKVFSSLASGKAPDDDGMFSGFIMHYKSNLLSLGRIFTRLGFQHVATS